MKTLIPMALLLVCPCLADVSHILPEYQKTSTTPPPSPRPYNFQYHAGRFARHVNHVHHDNGDDSGSDLRSYTFIDSNNEVRTVKYVANQQGYHPSRIDYEDIRDTPADTEAVQLAKQQHYELFEKIAKVNSQVPQDTPSVMREKDRHFKLYKKISDEHAAIAAERAGPRYIFDPTSGPYDFEEQQPY